MNKPLTLSDKILNILQVTTKSMTATDIRNAMPEYVDAGELSSRLTAMEKGGHIYVSMTHRTANTGRKLIKAYSYNPPNTLNKNNSHLSHICGVLLER